MNKPDYYQYSFYSWTKAIEMANKIAKRTNFRQSVWRHGCNWAVGSNDVIVVPNKQITDEELQTWESLKQEMYAELGYALPTEEKTSVCKHCGEEIVWVESSIEHFWTHKKRRIGFCDPNANWLTAKTWAWPEGEDEPEELILTIHEVYPKEPLPPLVRGMVLDDHDTQITPVIFPPTDIPQPPSFKEVTDG